MDIMKEGSAPHLNDLKEDLINLRKNILAQIVLSPKVFQEDLHSLIPSLQKHLKKSYSFLDQE